MSETVIRVENLSKKYVLGHQQERSSSIRDAISKGTQAFFQKFSAKNKKSNDNFEEFWALKDVSFEVKRGDRVGIIGRNGAGKSTLLKVLSRITEPTNGQITLQGRVASLLEVGTGFHPELSGRENIYLNGSILGMSRVDIQRKFDEIVAFAEVEKFLDTPVKRYSSGMYVRLAFAVAAFLEPEILIVDEVLAVGDAQFQKKCLGRMEEVSSEGRTILFVSHNMAAARTLCNRAVFLRNGEVLADAGIEKIIEYYLQEDAEESTGDGLVIWNQETAPQSPEFSFCKAYVLNEKGEVSSLLDTRKPFSIVVEYEVKKDIDDLCIGLMIQNQENICMCGSNDPLAWGSETRKAGYYTSVCHFPGYLFNTGRYSVLFGADILPNQRLAYTQYSLCFSVEDTEGIGYGGGALPGVLRPYLSWKVEKQ